VCRAAKFGHETVGFLDGWKGVRDDLSRPLAVADVADLLGKGGTILGSSRTNPFAKEADATKVLETLAHHHLDALVVIGGDDTLSAARELHRRGGHVVGVPKTMDNDVGGTDWTFGFHSATAVAVDALERLRDTAGSHLLAHVRAAVEARGYALVVASEGIDLGPRRGSAGTKDEFGHELLREREVGGELAR